MVCSEWNDFSVIEYTDDNISVGGYMPASYRRRGRYKSYSETRTAHAEMRRGQDKVAATQTTTASEGGTGPSYGVTAPSAPEMSMPSPSGKGGLVAFLATFLFIFATWNSLGSKVWGIIWGTDQQQITVYDVNWRLVGAGLLFIIASATIASINSDVGNILALMIIAMWLVYIIQPGNKNKSPLTSFFDWFNGTPQTQQQTSSPYGGGSFSTFGNTTQQPQKPANVK
jgi:hypothetical protein